MSQTVVTLNSQRYVLDGQVRRYIVDQLAPAVRQTGLRERQYRLPVSEWVFNDWSGGVGIRRIREGQPRDFTRFRDSLCETRFPGQITNGLLNESVTLPTLTNSTIYRLRATCEFLRDLWGVWEGIRTSTGKGQVFFRKFTGSSTSWTGGTMIAGRSRHTFTVTSYGIAGVGSITVVLNGVTTVKTKGTDYSNATSTTAYATSIRAALNTISGVTASGSTTEVQIDPTTATDSLTVTVVDDADELTDLVPDDTEALCVALDLLQHRGNLLCLVVGLLKAAAAGDGRSHGVFRSTNGTSWTDATTNPGGVNYLSDAVTAGEDIDAGRLAQIGLTAVAFLWDEVNGEIEAWKSTDAGATWSVVVAISSGGGPKGVANYFAQSHNPAILVGTSEGVYSLDLTNSKLDLILSLPFNSNNCRGMTAHNGTLYVPKGDGGMVSYFWNGNEGLIREMGLNRDDGVVTARQGYCTAQMVSAGRWLWMAYGGHAASLNAGIWCYDDLKDAWHSFYEYGTANRRLTCFAISNRDDDTMRLVASFRSAATTEVQDFLLNPLENPLQGGVFHYLQGTGIPPCDLDLPVFDGFLPHDNGAWLRVRVLADELAASATEPSIRVFYGADGAAWQTTALGYIYSDVVALTLGSDLGVSAKNMNLSLRLIRSSTNTTRAVLKEVAFEFLKKLPTLEGFEFTIDIEQSVSQGQEALSPETVITNLETAREAVPLVVLSYGESKSYNVTVRSLQFMEETLAGEMAVVDAGPRVAKARVVCEELI